MGLTALIIAICVVYIHPLPLHAAGGYSPNAAFLMPPKKQMIQTDLPLSASSDF